MNGTASLQPTLLGKMNEQLVLRVLQAHGPLSRAELARRSGLSAPTVSRASTSLLQAGLVEERDAPELGRGRPAKRLQLATTSSQVLGIVIDAGKCQVVSAGLDGELHAGKERVVATPGSYEGLLDALENEARQLMSHPDMTTLGVGLSLPGLIDYRHHRGILSPNVPITNGHSPGRDLADRLGLEWVMLHESHALCLAEQQYGLAVGMEDFAMLDIHVGVGLGVMHGGRLLTGHRGMAGEIGHIPVVADGRECGCGRLGCLETVASDSSLAWRVSRRLGRKLTIEQVIAIARQGNHSFGEDLLDTCRYLAQGAAMVINLFNPSTLFIHGQLFDADATLFEQMVGMVEAHTLPPSYADCQIIQARGRKTQGAIAGIIQHLTCSIAPSLQAQTLYFPTERSTARDGNDHPAALPAK